MKHFITLDNAPSKGILSPINLMKIKFKNLNWMQSISFSYPSSKTLNIKFIFNASDRISNKHINLTYGKTFSRKKIKSTKHLLSKIREMAKYTVCHEIDESLYFKNKRIFDPHL